MPAQAPGKKRPSNSRRCFLFSSYHAHALWLAVIALVLLIGALQNLKPGQDSPEKTEVSHKSISPAFLFTGRYTFGLKVSGLIPQNDWKKEDFGALLHQMDDIANSLQERICLTSMISELINSDEALAYLQRLKQDTVFSPAAQEMATLFSRIYTDGTSSLSQAEKDKLLDNYGWFGRLALSHDLPDTNTFRSNILNESRKTLTVSIFFLTGGTLIAFAGLILFIYTVAQVARKRLQFAYSSANPGNNRTTLLLLETMVLYLLFMAGSNIFSSHLPRMLLWLISVPLVIFILFWPRWRGMNMIQLRTSLGWHYGKGLLKETCSGIIGYVAGLPLIITGLFVSMQTIKFTGQYPVHPIVYEIQDLKGFPIVWIYALSCFIAPLLEESLFRGALYRSLRNRFSIVFSACINGLFFAVIHPQGIAAIPALGTIGITFCLLREWRDSLIAPITAHALNNFIVTSMLFFMF